MLLQRPASPRRAATSPAAVATPQAMYRRAAFPIRITAGRSDHGVARGGGGRNGVDLLLHRLQPQSAATAVDGPAQTGFQRDCRLPTQLLAHLPEVGRSLRRVVHRQRPMDHHRTAASQGDHLGGKPIHGERLRTAHVERANEIVSERHHAHETVDEITYVAEGADLRAVTEHRDVLLLLRLADETADHAAVVWVHAGPVGVEDADYLESQVMLTVVDEEESFRTPLPLIAAAARADGIDVSPILLGVSTLWDHRKPRS